MCLRVFKISLDSVDSVANVDNVVNVNNVDNVSLRLIISVLGQIHETILVCVWTPTPAPDPETPFQIATK